MIANHQPIPLPNAKKKLSPNVCSSLSCMNSEAPIIAQLTAINGKKIPSELYNDGKNFSIIISTNCTIAAITAINIIKLKNPRSTLASEGLIKDKAPGDKRYLLIKKLTGTVMIKTKITAIPNPLLVLTVLETAKYEHIPRK